MYNSSHGDTHADVTYRYLCANWFLPNKRLTMFVDSDVSNNSA